MKFWKTLSLSFLALAGWGVMVVWMMGCATMPPRPPYEAPVSYVHIPDSMVAAWTTCDSVTNRPKIEIDSTWASNNPQFMPEVMVHEKEHVRQLDTFTGGCKEGLRAYNLNPNLKLRWEMEAECARIHSKNLSTSEYTLAIIGFTTHYYKKGWVRTTELAMYHKFMAVCERGRR